MMHAMHDGIGARVQKRSALGDEGKDIKKALPECIHAEHFVGSIAVQVKRLTEKRKEPMSQEKH
jgi:hypothetical protein